MRIYSIDNKLIGEFGEKRRDPVTFDETPELLIQAILSAEDDAFYEHAGVDIKGLLRAGSQLLLSGEIQSGGSTITMQVARNFFLSLEQTFSRKFNEILLALKIERLLSKQEILELYLNKIYLGNRAYGVKAAAQVYYGIPLEQLTLAQMAMIAGLPKAPSSYNPIANPTRAKLRRDWILRRMLILEVISESAYQAAVSEPVTARYHGQKLELNAPYVAETAREATVERFGAEAYTQGYKVYTTISSRLQKTAQTAIINGLLNYDQRHGYRGPEQQLDMSAFQPLTPDSEASIAISTPGSQVDSEASDTMPTSDQIRSFDLTPLLEILRSIPVYGGLEPAVVIDIGERQISLLNSRGEVIGIAWENGLSQAKPFIDENRAGKSPKTAADVVQLGDIIRTYRDQQSNWHLGQLPLIQAALVAISPYDGAIVSMVGGFDFAQSSFNRATQAKRQVGSNFKPFIYTVALEKGFTAASIFNDAPIVIEDSYLESIWRPENAGGKFYGPTRLRKALYLSRNLISIRLLQAVGISDTANSMARFGMDSSTLPRNLSMALGSYAMTPLEIATGYSVFANGGYKIEPYLIHHIRDRHDKAIYLAQPNVIPDQQALAFGMQPDVAAQQSKALSTASALLDVTAGTEGLPVLLDTLQSPTLIRNETSIGVPIVLPSLPAEQVVDERVVFIMNSILRDVVKRGTGKRALKLGRSDLAGKTGTTNGPTDAWFSGYNRHLVTTAWVGFDKNQNLGRGEYGGVAALPIWIDYMRVALDGVPETLPAQPNGIVTVRIDPETGKRINPSDPSGIFEFFLEENAPEGHATAAKSYSDDTPRVAPEDLF